MTTHVYLKYAIALLMEEYGLRTEQEITFKEIKEELEKGCLLYTSDAADD